MTDLAARLDRALATYQAAHAAGRKRKMRQARTRVDACIRAMSLVDYLAHLNRDAEGFALTDDLAHWAEIRITTAPQLARYLDACVERERQKDALNGPDEDDDYDDGQPDEAQEWHDFDPDC